MSRCLAFSGLSGITPLSPSRARGGGLTDTLAASTRIVPCRAAMPPADRKSRQGVRATWPAPEKPRPHQCALRTTRNWSGIDTEATIMSTTIQDDMFAPDVLADPYAYYGRLREEDPIHWNEPYALWVVTRHDD